MPLEHDIRPFPADVWVLILQNLTVQEILKLCSLVGRALHSVATNDILWRALLVRDNSPEERTQQIAERYNGARSFLDLYRHRITLLRRHALGPVDWKTGRPGTVVTVHGADIRLSSFASPLKWGDLEVIDGDVARSCTVFKMKVYNLTHASTVEEVKCIMDLAQKRECLLFFEGQGEMVMEEEPMRATNALGYIHRGPARRKKCIVC